MVDFLNLPLEEKVLHSLNQVKTDFAFQPIFPNGGTTPVSYEALMRPRNLTPELLIDIYMLQGDLHTVELVTFYGAMLAYEKKGIKEKFSVNSFPQECFREKEAKVFFECFPDAGEHMNIELLEGFRVAPEKWMVKREQMDTYGINTLILDDFGTGHSNMEAVDFFSPDIVKIDQSVVSYIDRDTLKQRKFIEYVEKLHSKGVKVLAEGVETREEYEFVKDTPVDFLQGFFLGRPEI